MNFKTWIFLAESQQAHVEVQVGNFLTAMFEQAGSMFKLDRLHGERGDYDLDARVHGPGHHHRLHGRCRQRQ